MKKKKKQIIAKNMKIFGNCEVRVEEDKIYCRRYGKKNYYEGNLPDYTWKV